MQIFDSTQIQETITPAKFWNALNLSFMSYYEEFGGYDEDYSHDIFGLKSVCYERLKKHFSGGRSWLRDKIDLRTFQVLRLFFEFAKQRKWQTQLIKKGKIGYFNEPIPSTPSIYTVWVRVGCEPITPPWYKKDFELSYLEQVPTFSFMNLLYVGKTTDLSRRLPTHHRLKELEFIESCGLDVELLYLPENEFFKFKDLSSAELFFIENFYPSMNGEIFKLYEEVTSMY